MEQAAKTYLVALCLSVAVAVASTVWAVPTPPGSPLKIGLTEQLGHYVPEDLHFVADTGDTVRLGDLIDRPVLLTLVYYHCPSICRPLLDEVASNLGQLEQVDVMPGRDYRVLTVSFDPNDSATGSARIKEQYLHKLPADFPRDQWTFLTGDSTSIAKLTQAVGFGFQRNKLDSDFTHPTTLIILSPKGKVTRYMLGSEYLPLDIKLALIEARHGTVGTTIVKFYKLCFSYDPASHKFALNATRVVGASTLIGVAGILIFVAASGRRRRREKKKV